MDSEYQRAISLGKFAQIADMATELNIELKFSFMQIENNTVCMDSGDLAKLLDCTVCIAAALKAKDGKDFNSAFLADFSLEIMLNLKEIGYRI